MKDRIRNIMEFVQLSQQDFATRLDISPASLSSIFTGRTNPTNNHVMAIHRAFPDVNISWLMFGEGEMLLEPQVEKKSSHLESVGDSLLGSMNKNPELAGNVNDVNRLESTNRVQTELVDNFSVSNQGVPSNYNDMSFSANMELLSRMRAMERKTRRIKEIRVFYDDGTYEAFIPSNK